MATVRPAISTGDGLSLGVSLVLLEIPDDDWVKQAIATDLYLLTQEENWQKIGVNDADLSARIFSLILQTIQFDYEPPPMTEIGAMQMWPAAAAPAGWLLCQGQSLLRDDYVALFSVIGTTWGAVDGAHFTLPDFRDRSPMGQNLTVALGQYEGNLQTTILTAQMPQHNHSITDPGHTHPPLSPFTSITGSRAGGTNTLAGGSAIGGMLTTGSSTTGITGTQNTGGNDPIELLHPVGGVNFIIFAGI